MQRTDIYVEIYDAPSLCLYGATPEGTAAIGSVFRRRKIRPRTGGRSAINGGVVAVVALPVYEAVTRHAQNRGLNVAPLYDHERDCFPELEPEEGWPQDQREYV